MYMFLKQDKPEMDDIERRKIGSKVKILKNLNILRKYWETSFKPLQKFHKIFLHILEESYVSEHSKHFFFSGWCSTPPFLTCSLRV